MNDIRRESLRNAWRKRKDYIGADRKSSLYRSWRARVNTRKGREGGFPDSWITFQGFREEMKKDWEEGKILVRKNTKIPCSRDNCEWVDKGTENIGKLVKLEYNGKEQTLIEWANELSVNYNGIRQRYFKGKNYTAEQILYGKLFHKRREIRDHKGLEYQKRKDKISRMLSAYRLRDKKRGFVFDLPREYFENNIISQTCTYCGTTENVGCDRINNKQGHTMANVIPACYVCNAVRNNHFTVSEMKKIGKVIAQITIEREVA